MAAMVTFAVADRWHEKCRCLTSHRNKHLRFIQLTSMTTIAVYGREFQPSVIPYVQQLFDFLSARGVECWIYKPFHEFLEPHVKCDKRAKIYTNKAELPRDTKLMLSLGGDGTMLAAVSIVGDSGIPVAGINFGRLGFLASVNKDDIEQSMSEILDGAYSLQQRALLSVTSADMDLFGGNHYALNDITVFKHESSAMITVKAYLNGDLLNAYWADGIIIATPTGSTAYSLSCGGPIIMPSSGNFVITPVSPHNLNVRPVVISNDFELDLEVESRSDQFLLSCDSKTETISTSTRIKVTKADHTINLVRLKNDSFFSTLRNKLLWGLDARNY